MHGVIFAKKIRLGNMHPKTLSAQRFPRQSLKENFH
jgi:hypothetical protein